MGFLNRTVEIDAAATNPELAKGAKFIFRNEGVEASDGEVLPISERVVTTADTTLATLELPAKTTGSIYYLCKIQVKVGTSAYKDAGKFYFYFSYGDGSDIALSELYAGGTPATDTTRDYIDEKTTDERLTALIEPLIEGEVDEAVTEQVTDARLTALITPVVESATFDADQVTQDATHRFVSDVEKATWNAKDTDAITALRDGVDAAGDTLAKLYSLFQTLNSIVTGTTPDGDSVTNTIQEILAVFQTYPEGADIAASLAGKIDTSAIVNTLTETASGKVLDARQGKALKELIDVLTTSVGERELLANKATDFSTINHTKYPSTQAVNTFLSSVFASVRSNGATGDGATDDRAAIQATIDAVAAAGGGVVFLPAGTYLIKRPLILPSKITLKGAGIGATKITKPASVKSLLTANANTGNTSVTVADSTGFEVGGAIHINDTSNFEWVSTKGRITTVAGNVITFVNTETVATGVSANYLTSRAAVAATSFPLIRNVAQSTNICVRDLTLDQNQNPNDPSGATSDFTISTIHFVETYYSLVENCELLNAAGDAYSDQAQDGTGITPAANLIKTTKNTIRGCKIRNATRHAIHLGTCIRGGFILGNEMTNCGGYGYFYCAFVTETVAANNYVDSCLMGFAGIDYRDYDNIIANNHIRNCSWWGIEANSGDGTGGRLIIIGNKIQSASRGGIQLSQPDSIVSGNIINMATGEGIRLNTYADRALLSANSMIGTNAGGSVGLFLDSCDDVRIIGNSIRTVQNATSIRGVNRLVATGNQMSGMTNRAWYFQVSTSTDCVIKDERNNFVANPVIEEVAATRLVYEGLGTNGTSDPASSGAWNGISGKRYDGQMVRWNSGSGEKISIFYNGVGWTTLN